LSDDLTLDEGLSLSLAPDIHGLSPDALLLSSEPSLVAPAGGLEPGRLLVVFLLLLDAGYQSALLFSEGSLFVLLLATPDSFSLLSGRPLCSGAPGDLPCGVALSLVPDSNSFSLSLSLSLGFRSQALDLLFLLGEFALDLLIAPGRISQLSDGLGGIAGTAYFRSEGSESFAG